MKTSDQQFDVGVIVGRFQTDTLHKGHIDLIQHVCDAHEKVVIFLGVSPLWATRNNPLDFQSRKQMIQAEFPGVIVNYVEDMASDEKWSAALDRQVGRVVSPAQTAVLYGSRDSFIPYYSGRYPTRELESEQVYSASEERRRIAAGNTRATADFRAGVIWATQNQYPTGHPTADIAAMRENPLTGRTQLLLARKPDETKLRFVGGFYDPNKDGSLEATAIRELAEETGLRATKLPTFIASHRVDDWRYRSEANKIITSLFLVRDFEGDPKPDDDIAEVRWVDWDVRAMKFLHTDSVVREHHTLCALLTEFLVKEV